MTTSEYLTREELSAYLNTLSLSDLSDIAQERGLVIGGSGKDGKITKKDYVQSIGAHVVGHPTHVLARAIVPYHNGVIIEEAGINWRMGEKRVISIEAYRQIIQDAHPDNFEILSKMFTV